MTLTCFLRPWPFLTLPLPPWPSLALPDPPWPLLTLSNYMVGFVVVDIFLPFLMSHCLSSIKLLQLLVILLLKETQEMDSGLLSLTGIMRQLLASSWCTSIKSSLLQIWPKIVAVVLFSPQEWSVAEKILRHCNSYSGAGHCLLLWEQNDKTLLR